MSDATAQAAAREALLRLERVIAIVINAVVSMAFFFAVFGWAPVARGALALDFLPQTLGVSLLGSVVPALLMRRRMRMGTVAAAGPTLALPALLLRIVGIALGAVVVIGGTAAGLTLLLAPDLLAPSSAMLIKAVYGGSLGAIVTPPVLRMTLGMRLWPSARPDGIVGPPTKDAP